jgi:uncharacterized coiled-coil protein SlyX
MEEIRQQITALSHKVDSLYKIIEHLNDKLTESVCDSKLTEGQATDRAGWRLKEKITSSHSYSSLDPVLEHKDVLLDDYFSDKNFQSLEKELTADIQIQRLTAQLTAAYNRIAALEEQLLAKRIHS